MPVATIANQKNCRRHLVKKMEVRGMMEERIGKQLGPPQGGRFSGRAVDRGLRYAYI
jgi:hypothetical protein